MVSKVVQQNENPNPCGLAGAVWLQQAPGLRIPSHRAWKSSDSDVDTGTRCVSLRRQRVDL